MFKKDVRFEQWEFSVLHKVVSDFGAGAVCVDKHGRSGGYRSELPFFLDSRAWQCLGHEDPNPNSESLSSKSLTNMTPLH